MGHGKKITGGKYAKRRKKKKYELPGQRVTVNLSDKDKRRSKRVTGGNKKTFLLESKTINISDGKKIKKAEVKNVLETPSNRFLARQNVITKGTIVKTDLGNVKVTSRPSQEAVLNGVLIKK